MGGGVATAFERGERCWMHSCRAGGLVVVDIRWGIIYKVMVAIWWKPEADAVTQLRGLCPKA